MDHRLTIAAALLAALAWAPARAAPAAQGEDLAQTCARVTNDDTIREFTPPLLDRTRKAYKTLAPDAKGEPDASEFETQAQYRCMDGKVMVCFVGANLPCVKMNADRHNAGAVEYCRGTPNADFVPLVATGHDAVYGFRCKDGKAEVTGKSFELDERGFATKLWTPLPDR